MFTTISRRSKCVQPISGARRLHAQEKQLPDWVTDDKAKVWVVNSLVDFMTKDKFYKIKKIDVIRESLSESIHADLIFDDETCKGRNVHIQTRGSFCDAKSCLLFSALTDCFSRSMKKTKTKYSFEFSDLSETSL